jgi:vacuolar-type H+-ATPase subunit I/STV1
MDVTRTIRYEGPSHLEARILQGMLEEHGVHVEPAPKGPEQRDELVERQQRERRELVERQRRELAELQAQQEKERRELVERQQQERAEQSGALSEVTQLRQVVVDLEGTGAAVAIAAAVKSFRNLALGGKVEVEGEAQGKDDSG